MKQFKIAYVSRRGESKDWCEEIIEAKTEKSALNKFCKLFEIKLKDLDDTWWEGEFLNEFKSISEVEEEKKKYIIVGDNNFWYSTTSPITLKELAEEIKEVKKAIAGGLTDEVTSASELYVYEVVGEKQTIKL